VNEKIIDSCDGIAFTFSWKHEEASPLKEMLREEKMT
jgi:hypothetical protein